MPRRASIDLDAAVDLDVADALPPAKLLHQELRRVFAEAIDAFDLDAPSALAALRLFSFDVIKSTAHEAMFLQALAAFSNDTVQMARLLYDENGELREEPGSGILGMLNSKYRH